MTKKKILHIAPMNWAGRPYLLMKTENDLGYESTLITRTENPYGFEEDICLDLPLTDNWLVNNLRKIKEKGLSNKRASPDDLPPVFSPGKLSNSLYKIRDKFWKKILQKKNILEKILECDYLFLDGGSGLLYSGELVEAAYQANKKIVNFYYGSDLRSRGIFEKIDEMAYKSFSFEFDHRYIYSDITHLPFPFNVKEVQENYERKRGNSPNKIIIGHSPTKFHTKGSQTIIETVEELKQVYDIKLLLIHNLPYEEAMELKAQCDIFIDQLGELGYGISGLEALALGIPTVVTLKEDYEEFLGEHPFVNANAENLATKLEELITNKTLREKCSKLGPSWVKKQHSSEKIVEKIMKNIEYE